jgi:hypothetical protein
VCELVPFINADTVMYPYIDAAHRVITDGSLITVVNGAMHEAANLS